MNIAISKNGCTFSGLKPSILRIELRGADATLRVRQVKVVGHSEGELPALPTLSPASLQIYNCEQETLRVFRLLTSQVFLFCFKEDIDKQ